MGDEAVKGETVWVARVKVEQAGRNRLSNMISMLYFEMKNSYR